MKRESALVDYSSSESESDSATPPPKKRKLPVLSATLAGPEHVDNPSLHQGRARTTPHVDGQYATHVYASVPLDRGSTLFKLLCKILESAKKMTPTLHDFWSSSEPELHISLSRPIYLRAHQREPMKRAVKLIADKGPPPFTASFARITELVNDEGTRIFLALEIGAGHHELTALTTSLTPTLQAIRQQEFYPSPRFHASIAWALLGRRACSPKADKTTNTNGDQVPISSTSISSESRNSSMSLNEYPKITEFPPALLPTLNEQYGSSLASSVKSFDISEIRIKIGKEVSCWRLNGG
ncbi:U6 snRNA phosphodiesterase Usb1 [Mycena galopus ATCC 62051]|nr:U6 snRNA phosphodiesterase Usb1 [Mycena galopus ATCC 62051]